MRRMCPLIGMGLLLASTLPLAAQNILGNAQPMKFQPIDTSKALKAPDMSKFKIIGPKPATPNLTSIVPRFSLMQNMRWPGTQTPSPVLTPKTNPFQPTPPTGSNPFNQKPVNASPLIP
jgi:hypothetical protein